MTFPELLGGGLGSAPITWQCVFGLEPIVHGAASIRKLAPTTIFRNKRLPLDPITAAWAVGTTRAVVDGFFK